jgi:hypothetical protein
LPFSSLNDPIDVARAQAALDAAWDQVRDSLKSNANVVEERSRLAGIVVGLVGIAEDETDLARRAVDRFFKMIPKEDS